jgi:thymidylate synthase ThyX
LIEVIGKFGIKATVLAHSVSPQGIPFITYEIEYPRLILAELNTHRMLSKNSFSSRAVPFNKMIEQLNGRPVRFGQANPGMQDRGEDYNVGVNYLFPCPITGVPQGGVTVTALEAWEEAKRAAIRHAKAFYEAGYHKQIYNRLLEPFQMMKTIISGTEWANFFWLRDDEAADPTLRELARVMKEAKEQSTPELLQPGEWHLPYIDCAREDNGDWSYSIVHGEPGGWQGREYITLEDAIKVSCARCAAVSYRNEGYALDKSLEVYERLVGSDKKHASALEHCVSPMQALSWGSDLYEYGGRGAVNQPQESSTWEPGVTHADRKGNLWSGNLKGWIQYRKLIPGECYEGA